MLEIFKQPPSHSMICDTSIFFLTRFESCGNTVGQQNREADGTLHSLSANERIGPQLVARPVIFLKSIQTDHSSSS